MRPIFELLKFIFFSIPLGILVYTLAIIIQQLVSLYKTIKNLNHGHWK